MTKNRVASVVGKISEMIRHSPARRNAQRGLWRDLAQLARLARLCQQHYVLHPLLTSPKHCDALLPISQFTHPNKFMHETPENWLIHVLEPLKIAAKIGIMRSDPLGSSSHCFTPLA
jgi:hypothetical protein